MKILEIRAYSERNGVGFGMSGSLEPEEDSKILALHLYSKCFDLVNEKTKGETEGVATQEYKVENIPKCEKCKGPIKSDKVVEYSKKHHDGKVLCYDCQKLEKKEDTQ